MLTCCRFRRSEEFSTLTQLLGEPEAAPKSKAPRLAIAKPRRKESGVDMPQVSHLAAGSRRRVRFEELSQGPADVAQPQQENTAGPSSPSSPNQLLLEQKRQQCLDMFQSNALTAPQRPFLEQMGLGTKGPADTIGDGECQFRGFSQSEAVISKGTVWSMSNSEEAQSGYASARSIAVAAIRANPVVQEGIVEHASQVTSDSRHQGRDYRQALGGENASALPALMADKVQMPISSGNDRHDTRAAFVVWCCTLFCVHVHMP